MSPSLRLLLAHLQCQLARLPPEPYLLYTLKLDVTSGDTILTDSTLTTQGSYKVGDFTNLRLWYSSDASFSQARIACWPRSDRWLDWEAEIFLIHMAEAGPE